MEGERDLVASERMCSIETHIKYTVLTPNWYNSEGTDALTPRTQMSEVVVVQKKPVLSPLRHYANSSRDQPRHVLLIKRVGTRRSKRPRPVRGQSMFDLKRQRKCSSRYEGSCSVGGTAISLGIPHTPPIYVIRGGVPVEDDHASVRS
jgi:hypothetical protein